MKQNIEALGHRIDQAMLRQSPTTLIRNVTVFNVATGDSEVTDIALSGDTIVSVYEPVSADAGMTVIDGTGLTAVPGFINTHGHIESSCVTPYEYDRMVLPFGETTFIWDPHEIANKLGWPGMQYSLEAARHTAMDLIVQMSSCVPATSYETSGAWLGAADLRGLHDHASAGGLAEVMDTNAVLNHEPEMMQKLLAGQAWHMPIDGHMPGLRGPILNALQVAGLRNDHEATDMAEAREKLKKGLQLLIRKGSATDNLSALFNLITLERADRLCFCTDDIKPHDVLAQRGTVAHMIRWSIAQGASPLAVYRMATLSAANHFRLHDRGLIAAGRKADIVLLRDLAACDVHSVIKNGEVVNDALFARRKIIPPVGLSSVKLPELDAARLMPSHRADAPVIGYVPNSLMTKTLRRGECDVNDLARLVCIESHGKNGNFAVESIAGFGLKIDCAIGTTVAHDHHNTMIAGNGSENIIAVARHLQSIGGGFALAVRGQVVADLPLPIAGLMSDRPFEDVAARLKALNQAAAQACSIRNPFMALSFMGLCVIPELKLTDKGLTRFDPANGDTGPRLAF